MAFVTHDPLVGKKLDSYYIERLLGRGGMARVYRGYDINLRRYAAIKVISPDLKAKNQPKYEERFRKEARAVAQLKNANIVGVYHFGLADDLYYMAMEYIDGTDLEWVMDDYHNDGELLSYDEIYRVIRKVANALDYAHSEGVLHRDIKPSNIMIDERGEPILTDFGLALITSEGTSGDIFGSPYYISPEQAVNSADAVPQSDLYSLGVVLYKMLTGSTPFNDETPMQIAMAHMVKAPPPPEEFYPEIHPAFEAVLEKAIAKKPEDRYKTGAQMVRALKRAINEAESDPVKQAQPRVVSSSTGKPVFRLSEMAITAKISKFRHANPLPTAPPIDTEALKNAATPAERQEMPAIASPGETEPVVVEQDVTIESIPEPITQVDTTFDAETELTQSRRTVEMAKRKRRSLLFLILLVLIIGGGAAAFFMLDPLSNTGNDTSVAAPSVSTAPITMVIEGPVEIISDTQIAIYGLTFNLPDDPRFEDLRNGDTLWMEAAFSRSGNAFRINRVQTVAVNSVVIELEEDDS